MEREEWAEQRGQKRLLSCSYSQLKLPVWRGLDDGKGGREGGETESVLTPAAEGVELQVCVSECVCFKISAQFWRKQIKVS